MASRGVHHLVALDLAGNAMAGATVEVRPESDPLSFAAISLDREGATPLANPNVTSSDGSFTFYAPGSGGGYRIKITKDGDEKLLRNVPIGTAGEYDPDGLPLTADELSFTQLGAGAVVRTVTSKLRESASVTDFGAVPDSPSAAAANAAAFAAALAASPTVFVPPTNWHIQDVTIPTTAKWIFGGGTLIAAGSPTAFKGILDADGNTSGLLIDGLTILVDTSLFPNTDAVFLKNCVNPTVRNVKGQGALAIHALASTNTVITACSVSAYKAVGIYCQDCFNTDFTNNFVTGGAVGSAHGIQTIGGGRTNVIGNHIAGAQIFGISAASLGVDPNNFVNISNNICLNSKREGINLNHAAHFAVGNNVLFFDSTSLDFGLSLFGDSAASPAAIVRYGTVTGNLIYNPWKSGIGIDDDVKNVLVTGNHIYAPNQGNGVTEDFRSGVLLKGGNCQFVTVVGNYFSDPAGRMDWQVNEWNAGGTPNNNIIGPNYGSPGLLGSYRVQGANTEPAWKAYTPVVTAGAGAFTSVSATGRFMVIGKIVHFTIAITITTNGTAAGDVRATMPATIASGGGVVSGRADGVSGKMLQGVLVAGTTTLKITNFDNTYPGANGEVLRVSGSYEAA